MLLLFRTEFNFDNEDAWMLATSIHSIYHLTLNFEIVFDV